MSEKTKTEFELKVAGPMPRLTADQAALDWSDAQAFERQSAFYPNNRSHGVKIDSITSRVHMVDPAPGMPDRKQKDGSVARQQSPADQCEVWIKVVAVGPKAAVDAWSQRVREVNSGDDNVLRGRGAHRTGGR